MCFFFLRFIKNEIFNIGVSQIQEIKICSFSSFLSITETNPRGGASGKYCSAIFFGYCNQGYFISDVIVSYEFILIVSYEFMSLYIWFLGKAVQIGSGRRYSRRFFISECFFPVFFYLYYWAQNLHDSPHHLSYLTAPPLGKYKVIKIKVSFQGSS